MSDGQMEFVRKGLGSAVVLLDEDGRVLLLRRSYPPHDWILPGGNAEADESPVETARREVREETGLEIAPERLVGVYYQADHRAGEFIHFVFRASIGGVAAIYPDPAEVDEWAFFNAAELPQPISPSTVQRVADAFLAAPLALPIELPPRSEP